MAIQLEDIILRITTDIKGDEQLTKLVDTVDELNKKKVGENLMKSSEDVVKILENVIKKYKEQNGLIEKSEKQTENLAKANTNANKSLLEIVKNFQVFGIRLGDVLDKGKEYLTNLRQIGTMLRQTTALTEAQTARVNALGTGFGSGARTATALIRTFNLLKVALNGLGIGLLITAFTSLIAVFRRTTGGSDVLAKVLGSISAVTGVLLDKVTDLGKALIFLFQGGGLVGAANLFSDSLSNIGDEINEAVKAAQRLVDINREITNSRLTQASAEAELNRAIKEQNKIGEDTTKSLDVREAAIKRSIDLSRQLLNERQSFNVQEQDALRERIGLEGDENKNIELQIELDQKRAEFINRETEILELQTTQQNKLNAIRKEASDAAARAAAARQKEAEQRRKDEEAELKRLEEIKRALASNQNVQAIESLREQAARVREEVTAILEEFELTGAFEFEGDFFKLPEPEGFKQELQDFLNSSLDVEIDGGTLTLSDRLSDALLSVAENPEIKETLLNGLNAVKEFTDQILQTQIDSLDTALEKQRDVVAELVDAETLGGERQLQAAIEREEKLNEQREKAIENQRRLSAIQVAISQANAIASGVEAVSKAFALPPPLGIPTGIATSIALAAQIGAIIASITNLFGSIPSFYEGVESLGEAKSDNRVNDGKGGQIIIAHPNERIMTANQNKKLIELGLSNNDVVKYAIEGYTRANASHSTNTVIQYQIDNRKLLEEVKELRVSNERTNKFLEMLKIEFNVTDSGIYGSMRKYKGAKIKSKRKLN